MTEKDWWDIIFDEGKPENADDPEIREWFAVWLVDECDDHVGAAYQRWLLDTSAVNNWFNTQRTIRGPRGKKGAYWWFDGGAKHPKDYMPENCLAQEVWSELKCEAIRVTKLYATRRAAEEDAMRAWRVVYGKKKAEAGT